MKGKIAAGFIAVMMFATVVALATAYLNGQGVAADHAEAAAWFRRAAERGSALADYNLGMQYANGDGVPRDTAAALIWLDAAVARANRQTRQKFAMARDAVAQSANELR